MPAPLPGGVTTAVARLTVDTLTENQHCQNTFDYMASAPGTPSVADLAALMTAWSTAVQAGYLACLSPLTYIFSKTVAELHYGTTPTSVTIVTPSTLVGTAGATNLPLEVSATINRIGSVKGKHGRGRVQMPAIPNTFTTPATAASVMNTTGFTAYNNLVSLMGLVLSTTSFNWTPIISMRPIPPSTTVQFASIIRAFSVNTILGTQRRRKIGRGI